MNTKVKLISTISVFCMVLALLVTGVWAVSTANVTLGGTVTFTADNIHATITGSITGTQETVSITPLVYDADTVPSDEDKATWNNNVNFGTGNLITMKVKIKNESSERSLFVKVTDNTTTSNITKTFTSTVANVGSGTTHEVIKGGEIEYTLTLKVTELDYSASATYALDVDLRDANAPEEEEEEAKDVVALDDNKYANGLTYSLNEETQIATITAYDNSCNDNVVIPAYVSYGGVEYTITEINGIEETEQNPDGGSYFTNVTKITLPQTLKTIGRLTFYGCSNLKTVDIPAGVTIIGDTAFHSSGITSIVIPDGVERIEISTFSWCESLTSVTFGSNITYIGSDVFANAPLADVYYAGTETQWNAIDMGNMNSELTSAEIHYNYVAE